MTSNELLSPAQLSTASTLSELESPAHSALPLPAPGQLRALYSLDEAARERITSTRKRLKRRIEDGQGPPIAIVGPCSIHCETSALEYAERIRNVQERLGDRVQIVMRAYFEKPRTTVGWKGFLYDPDLDGSSDLVRGLARARRLLVQLSEIGVPLATEVLDPLTVPFIEDCLSWVAVGARTSESQIHRQMASGLLCPVGFKNGTDGQIVAATQAIESAASAHTHLGIDEFGQVALLRSPGNQACHVVLRGGKEGPNYAKSAVAQTALTLKAQGRAPRILVDCSHQNSGKDHLRQPEAARAVIEQIGQNHADVIGFMLESHLNAGSQPVDAPHKYGVSITDSCIDFSTTEILLDELANQAG